MTKRGVVRVTRPIFNFDACNHISGTAKAKVAKFCMHVVYIKCWPWDDKLPPNGCGQGHVTLFSILATMTFLESVTLLNTRCRKQHWW